MEKIEYCLLRLDWACLPSSDWAAWVQAGGSILALIVAILLAKRQGEREMAFRANDRAENRGREIRVIIFLTNSLLEYLAEFVKTPAHQLAYDKPSVSAAIGALHESMRQAPTSDLNEAELAIFFKLRNEFSETFGHTHFGNLNVFVGNHIAEITRLRDKFIEARGGQA